MSSVTGIKTLTGEEIKMEGTNNFVKGAKSAHVLTCTQEGGAC